MGKTKNNNNDDVIESVHVASSLGEAMLHMCRVAFHAQCDNGETVAEAMGNVMAQVSQVTAALLAITYVDLGPGSQPAEALRDKLVKAGISPGSSPEEIDAFEAANMAAIEKMREEYTTFCKAYLDTLPQVFVQAYEHSLATTLRTKSTETNKKDESEKTLH